MLPLLFPFGSWLAPHPWDFWNAGFLSWGRRGPEISLGDPVLTTLLLPSLTLTSASLSQLWLPMVPHCSRQGAHPQRNGDCDESRVHPFTLVPPTCLYSCEKLRPVCPRPSSYFHSPEPHELLAAQLWSCLHSKVESHLLFLLFPKGLCLLEAPSSLAS